MAYITYSTIQLKEWFMEGWLMVIWYLIGFTGLKGWKVGILVVPQDRCEWRYIKVQLSMVNRRWCYNC